MSGRKLFSFLLVMAVVVVGSFAAAQKSDYQRRVEEWNAYQDIVQAQEPNARVEAIETFLRTYPESQYSPYVFYTYAETALAARKELKAIAAVDGFLGLPREVVTKTYRESNPNIDETAMDRVYYQLYVFNTFAFLQGFRENLPKADEVAKKSAERARQGLELHHRLYAMVAPPEGVTPEQFQQIKQREEQAFHTLLAFDSFRDKNFAEAAREYKILVEANPQDPFSNYRLGLSHLQSQPPHYLPGFWYVARAVALNVQGKEKVREYLQDNLEAYQGMLPTCDITNQVDALIEHAGSSATPPADWRLPRAQEVNTLRTELTVKRIFDDLRAGGELARTTWVASCGMEIPELAVLIVEVADSHENLVTLRAAAGQEAVDAKSANLVVTVMEPPEAKNLKRGDVVRVSGRLISYQNVPEFFLTLGEAKVNPEDIPTPERAPRRRGGGR